MTSLLVALLFIIAVVVALVEASGLEPKLTEPKSVVLPLHHTSIIKGDILYGIQKASLHNKI